VKIQSSPQDFTYLNYSKVKLKIVSSSFGNYTLKGFINFIKDTSVCFKFYGPLSIEAVEGRLERNLDVKDVYNDRMYSNLLTTIMERDGIRITLRDVQNLFYGNVSFFLDSIQVSNSRSLRIMKDSNLAKFTLVCLNNKAKYAFIVKKNKTLVKDLVIDYFDGSDFITIDFKVLASNNERRKCNVRF
jgi:hypothetical protein